MSPSEQHSCRKTHSMSQTGAWPVLFFALLLAACGGGSGETQSGAGAATAPPPGGSAPPTTPPPPTTPTPPTPPPPIQPPSPLPPPDSAVPPAIVTIGAALPEPFPDSDYDGIPDHLDAFPFEAPVFTGPGSATWMRVDAAWTEIAGREVPDTVVAGHDLVLRGQGLGAGAGGEWVVFDTRRGKIAVRPQIVAAGTWRVAPPPFVLAMHTVVGNLRSESRSLSYVEPGAPVLFVPEGRGLAGSSLRLEGRNLAGVDGVALGSTQLPVEASGPDFVRVTLPASADANTLRVLAGGWQSNPVKLDYRRAVTFTIDASLPLAPGAALRINHDGAKSILERGEAFALEVPAHRVSRRRLDLVTVSGEVIFDALGVIFWPGSDQASVTLDGTIASDLLGFWPMIASGGGADWREQQVMMEHALAFAEAGELRDALVGLLHHSAVFPRYQLQTRLAAAVDRAAQAEEEFEVLADGPSLGFGAGLNERRMTDLSVTVIGLGSDPDADASLSTYSQYTIQRASGCATPGLPPDISPSDVCVENGTNLPSSIAVYLPPRFSGGAYTPVAAHRQRSHIGGVTDPRRVGQETVVLTSDGGWGLCGMQTCYVEVITAGLGLGTAGVSLTSSERRIADNLRFRYVLDVYVLPFIKDAIGLEGDAADTCLFDALVGDQVGLGAAVANFFIAADKNPAAAPTQFDQTIGKFLEDTLKEIRNVQTADKILQCAQQEIPDIDDVRSRISQKFSGAARVLGFVSLFLEVVETTMRFGGELFTPEKMLFQVVHRAEITGVSPRVLDLNDIYSADGSGRVFRISGDWLANTSADASSAQAFLPTEVVFTDRRGTERRFTVRADQVVLGPNPEREILLSVPNLAFFNPDVRRPDISLSGLEPGRLQMRLEYDHPDFAFDPDRLINYPDGVLKVPSPVDLELVTPPRIIAFDPPAASPGQQVRASGSGLERFAARPHVVLLRNSVLREAWSGGLIPGEVRDGRLLFNLPACASETGCVPRGEWLVELNDGLYELDQVVVSEHAFWTGPQIVIPVVKLGDFSSSDDVMQLKLVDANGKVLQERRLPDVIGDRFVTLIVDDPALISAVEVECVDAGGDSTCTYDLTGTDIEFVIDGNFLPGTGGQIPEGTSIVFPVCTDQTISPVCAP